MNIWTVLETSIKLDRIRPSVSIYLIASPAAASETALAIAELLTVRLRFIISSNSTSLICGCSGGCSGNCPVGGIDCGFTPPASRSLNENFHIIHTHSSWVRC